MSRNNPLQSALVIILVSLGIATAVTTIAGIVVGEPLYFIASGLFVVAGVAGVLVIRSLSRKIGGK
ncbi:MAG: hypothetical protein ACO3I4_02825 [Candidatus Kapaibacteriota bacterium]|jgi:hypothetical protein